MSLRVFYLDESHNDEKFVLSGISIEHSEWKEAFSQVKAHRQKLKRDYGIKMSAEIHSYKFVKGKGRSFGDRNLTKYERARVFDSLLETIASLPSVRLFNICLEKKGKRDPQMEAWDRMINRIDRSCKARDKDKDEYAKSLLSRIEDGVKPEDLEVIRKLFDYFKTRAMIISDEGRESQITQMLRRMHVRNMVPSKFGKWENGESHKNIMTECVIEDVVFKRSERSYFIQLADAAAYSLLKREVEPTAHIKKYEIHKMWDRHLAAVSHKYCSTKDPHGIVRK